MSRCLGRSLRDCGDHCSDEPDARKGFSEGYHETSTAPAPRPRYKSAAEQKRDFAASIDRSVAAARIAGSMFKFVRPRVELSCSVRNVPIRTPLMHRAGRMMTPRPSSSSTVRSSLSRGSTYTSTGSSRDPIEGRRDGGETHFRTVKAVFIGSVPLPPLRTCLQRRSPRGKYGISSSSSPWSPSAS